MEGREEGEEHAETTPPVSARPITSDSLEYASVEGQEEGSLLSQFHEDAIKQVGTYRVLFVYRLSTSVAIH
jgi:hypothetical protein